MHKYLKLFMMLAAIPIIGQTQQKSETDLEIDVFALEKPYLISGKSIELSGTLPTRPGKIRSTLKLVLTGELEVWKEQPWAADSHPKNNAITVRMYLAGYDGESLKAIRDEAIIRSEGEVDNVHWDVSRNRYRGRDNLQFKLEATTSPDKKGAYMFRLSIGSITWGPGEKGKRQFPYPEIKFNDLKGIISMVRLLEIEIL